MQIVGHVFGIHNSSFNTLTRAALKCTTQCNPRNPLRNRNWPMCSKPSPVLETKRKETNCSLKNLFRTQAKTPSFFQHLSFREKRTQTKSSNKKKLKNSFSDCSSPHPHHLHPPTSILQSAGGPRLSFFRWKYSTASSEMIMAFLASPWASAWGNWTHPTGRKPFGSRRIANENTYGTYWFKRDVKGNMFPKSIKTAIQGSRGTGVGTRLFDPIRPNNLTHAPALQMKACVRQSKAFEVQPEPSKSTSLKSSSASCRRRFFLKSPKSSGV